MWTTAAKSCVITHKEGTVLRVWHDIRKFSLNSSKERDERNKD
jgi:hypothetical protein